MKPENPAKHFILAFAIALAGYGFCYFLIQHWRTRKGPWEVTFIAVSNATPAIAIQQPKLGIANVRIAFSGESLAASNRVNADLPTKFTFREPRPVPYDVPFGKCVFMDTISLPGTVTFQMFGHEVELLPRVLIIDRREYSWRAEETISLDRSADIPVRSNVHMQ